MYTISSAAGSKTFWRVGDKYLTSPVILVWQGFGCLQIYLQNLCFFGDNVGEGRWTGSVGSAHLASYATIWNIARKDPRAPRPSRPCCISRMRGHTTIGGSWMPVSTHWKAASRHIRTYASIAWALQCIWVQVCLNY